MFDLFKKKNKEKNKKSEQTKVKQPIDFAPVFNLADGFINQYCNTEPSIPIGKYNGRDINVSMGPLKCNDVLVVTNDKIAVQENYIAPILAHGGMSYILYDKNGEYYNRFGNVMRDRGYDVQLVDFADPNHGSRIDLFEIVNTIKNPYWMSLIISSSIKCNAQEVKASHNLFMAMFEYLFSVSDTIDYAALYALFNGIKEKDRDVLSSVIQCEKAQKYMLNLTKIDHDVIKSAYDKVDNLFFKNIFRKIKNPNIYTMAVHQKKTIFFIKEVPARYRVLSTILMMNIKTANVICGYGKPSTLLFTFGDESWYNEPLLDKACDDIGNMGGSVSELSFRSDIGNESYRREHNKQLIIYCNSKDTVTKDFVMDKTKIKNWTKSGQKMVSENYFGGKALPSYALEASPITYNELDTLNDSIVIEPCGVSDPFRCDLTN